MYVNLITRLWVYSVCGGNRKWSTFTLLEWSDFNTRGHHMLEQWYHIVLVKYFDVICLNPACMQTYCPSTNISLYQYNVMLTWTHLYVLIFSSNLAPHCLSDIMIVWFLENSELILQLIYYQRFILVMNVMIIYAFIKSNFLCLSVK